jgi:glycosyltransferase involved in cell wall biosynthesis
VTYGDNVGRKPERLRVLRVISRLNVGGPAVQTEAICRGLDPERFDHVVLAGHVGADEADHVDVRAGDLEVHRVPGLGRAVRPGDDVRAFAALVRAMRRFRPHIVHTHAAKAGALGRIAAAVTGVPIVVHTFHGHLLHGYFSPVVTQAVVAAERVLARRTDRIIAVARQVRDDLLAARVGRLDQYAVVPPGTQPPLTPGRDVARKALGVPADAPVVAFVGRLTAVKRVDRLLATWQAVRRALPDARLLVCGDGELAGQVHAAGPALGVQPLGWRADVGTVYAAADLVLLTSDNEGMPVCLIEAALAGIPAVAPRVGGVPEVVVDGVTGSVCDKDPHQLAAAVAGLLLDDDRRSRLGAAAQRYATQHFTADRLVADLAEIYTDLARARGLAARRVGEPVG